MIPNLSTNETSKGGSDHSPLGGNLRQTSGKEVDVLDVILVRLFKSFHRPRTHDVVEVWPGLDFRQAAEFSPLGVARKAVIATSLNDLRNEVESETCSNDLQNQ